MAILLHPLSPRIGTVPIHCSQEFQHRTLAEDRPIVERVVAAYHHGKDGAPPAVRQAMYGEIWGENGFGGQQGGLIEALEQRSCVGVHDVLRQFFRTEAASGIALGKGIWELVAGNDDHRRHLGHVWLDRLVGLAQALGVLSLPNPEDSPDRWQRCLEVDPEAVFTAIEDHLDLQLEFPDLGGVFCGGVRGRAFPFIAFTHLLVAVTVRDLVAQRRPTIFEIGGGYGGLAHFACELLPCRYTIFDLPFAGATQAYFLSRALPTQRLVLCGEKSGTGPEISIRPAWDLLDLPPDVTADLVVNQDSMPEIPHAMVCRYLEAMKRFLRGPFLSINQEPSPAAKQTVGRASVAAAVQAVGGYRRFSRTPFFLRLGYVQEIYFPTRLRSYDPLAANKWARPGSWRRNATRSMRTALRLLRAGDWRGLGERLHYRIARRRKAAS
jgi:hypothetical protein